jgi:hypothetical protein
VLEEVSKLLFDNTALDNFKAVFNLDSTGPDEHVRKKINDVLHSNELDYQSTYKKIKKILEIQYFYRYELYEPFLLPLDTLIALCERYSQVAISVEELKLVGRLHTLFHHLRNKTITKFAIQKDFPEFTQYASEVIVDPLTVNKNDYVKLTKEFYQSSDVVKVIKKFKIPTLETIINKAPKLTHREFINLCDQYYIHNGIDIPNDRLEQCRLTTKFKIPREAVPLIRLLRKKFVTGQELEVRLFEDLYSLLGLKNFSRVREFLWRGFKSEFIKICETKNKIGLQALILKYPQYADRIEGLYERRISRSEKPTPFTSIL